MGWIGNIFIWIGLFMVGSRNRNAFIWTIIGESIWVFYAAYWGWWDLAISCLVFIALAANNWRQWGEPATAADFQALDQLARLAGEHFKSDAIQPVPEYTDVELGRGGY